MKASKHDILIALAEETDGVLTRVIESSCTWLIEFSVMSQYLFKTFHTE